MARVGKVLGSYREKLNPTVTVRKQPRPMVDKPGWQGFADQWKQKHPNYYPGAQPNAGAGDPAALPVDPLYESQVAGLGNQRDNTVAGLNQQRTSGLLDYGYNASYDDQGRVTGLNFDPNNPNSRAAQLKRRYNESKQGTLTNYAARGQLYAGSLLNAQDINAGNYQRADDSNQKALINFLNRNQGAITGANTNYELGVGQAQGDRINRAPSSPLYNPSSPSAPTPTPTPSSQPAFKAVPGKNAAGVPGVWHIYHADGRKVFVRK